MNRLSTRQLDWRCDGESRSYRGRVAHVVTMLGGMLPLTVSTIEAATARKPMGFNDVARGSPG